MQNFIDGLNLQNIITQFLAKLFRLFLRKIESFSCFNITLTLVALRSRSNKFVRNSGIVEHYFTPSYQENAANIYQFGTRRKRSRELFVN